MTVTATHPRDALFDADDTAATALPVCDHYCGVEVRMHKSLALQAELGPVFDITLDCEDGAPIGGEAAHAHMVAEIAMSAENRFDRVGARVHPVDHPSFADDIATLVGRAGERLAYLMLPKPRSLADVERACAEIDHQSRVRGLATDRRAVFAIECDVEHRPEFGLQFEALAHARLDAAIVVADGQRGGRCFVGIEQRVAWVGGRDSHGEIEMNRVRPRAAARR